MTLQDIEGFDNLATGSAESGALWPAGGPTVTTTNAKSGGKCAQTSFSNTTQTFKISPAGDQQEGYYAGHFYFDSSLGGGNEGFFSFNEGNTVHLAFGRDNLKRLVVMRGTTVLATSTIITLEDDTHYWISMYGKVDNSAGAYQVRVQGFTAVPDASGVDTQNGGTAVFNRYGFGRGNSNVMYFDNCHFGYGSPAHLAESIVVPYAAQADATAAGTYEEWSLSTGADQGALLDEATQNGDTDYVETDVLNERFLVQLPATGLTGTVNGYKTTSWAKKDVDGAARGYTHLQRSNGNDDLVGVEHVPGTAGYAPFEDFIPTNPDTGSPFTVSELDAHQIGAQLTTAA